MGGIMIPKLNLILGLLCREYYADKAVTLQIGGELDPQCRTPEVSAHASLFGLYGGLISGIMGAIIAPKMGALSDRLGRRPIMMLCNTGSLTGEIITIIAATYPETFKVYWILVGYFLDGLTGSMMASMAVSHSYATDCTAPSKRNVIFGYFHGVLFVGIALGPLIAAWVIKSTNNIIWMFYIALACHLFFISLLAFVIPESLPKKSKLAARERHRQHRERHGHVARWRANTESYGQFAAWILSTKGLVVNFFEPLKILYPKDDPIFTPAARRNLVLLASLDGIIFGVGTGAMTVIVLYSNFHFKWDTVTASYFISLMSILRTFTLFVILPTISWLFLRRVRIIPGTGTNLYELSIIRVAIFMDVLGFVGYSLATSGTMFMASGAVASMGGMGSPTLQAALTKHVPPDRIGQLLGAMALLHAIARVTSPVIFNMLYSLTVGKFDQAVFFVLTVLFACAWGVSWMITPDGKSAP
jgi:hypothetical protein